MAGTTKAARMVADEKRQALYAEGLSDGKIALALGQKYQNIARWRHRNNLPPNAKVFRRVDDERMNYYQDGLSDNEIADKVGSTRAAILKWRKFYRLPSNSRGVDRSTCGRHLRVDERAARLLLYQLGYSDRAIARQQMRSMSSIERWRSAMGLPPHKAPPVTVGNLRRSDPHGAILRRIKRAIGSHLASDVADDACSDLMLAVMSGAIPLTEIEKAARRFGNRALETYASKWGAKSIDEVIAGTDHLRMVDTLLDERSSSWLEEMGATVW